MRTNWLASIALLSATGAAFAAEPPAAPDAKPAPTTSAPLTTTPPAPNPAPADAKPSDPLKRTAPNPTLAPLVGQAAPEWTLADSAGAKVTLSKLKGKVVVLEFQMFTRPQSQKLMPIVQNLADHYKSTKDPVEVYALDIWARDGQDPAAYMKEKKFTFNLLPKADDVAKLYGVQSLPTFYVVGKDGVVTFSRTGASTKIEQEVAEAVEKAIHADEAKPAKKADEKPAAPATPIAAPTVKPVTKN